MSKQQLTKRLVRTNSSGGASLRTIVIGMLVVVVIGSAGWIYYDNRQDSKNVPVEFQNGTPPLPVELQQ